MKRFQSIFFKSISIAILIIILSGISFAFYFYKKKDKIVETIIKKIEIERKVKIHKSNINLEIIWKKFILAFKIKDIKLIYKNKIIFKANELFINIDFIKFLKKIYAITYLKIVEGEVNRLNNYTINYKNNFLDKIKVIELIKFKIYKNIYLSKLKTKLNNIYIENAKIDFAKNNITNCQFKGFCFINQNAEDLKTKFNLKFIYNNKIICIAKTSVLFLKDLTLNILGNINLKQKILDLQITTNLKNFEINKLNFITKNFLKTGQIDFLNKMNFYKTNLKIEISKSFNAPNVVGYFQIPFSTFKINENVVLVFKNLDFKIKINNLNNIENSSIIDINLRNISFLNSTESFKNTIENIKSTIFLKNIKQNDNFFLKAKIQDFKNFNCKGKVFGNIVFKNFTKIYDNFKLLGKIFLNFNFDINLIKIFKGNTFKFNKLEGIINTNNCWLNLGKTILNVNDGKIFLSENNLKDVFLDVELPNKDKFKFNGSIYNFINFFRGGKRTEIHGKFLSDQINFFYTKEKYNHSKDFYELILKKLNNLYANVTFNIKRFKYFNYILNNFNLEIFGNNENFKLSKLITYFSGGEVKLMGNFEKINDQYLFKLKCNLKRILLNKLFLSFKNFNQTFIKDKNIKGKLYSNINLSGATDPSFNVLLSTLNGNIDYHIKNLVLDNFKLIKYLKKYLNLKNVKKIYFEKPIKNILLIKNYKVLIPKSYLCSNLLEFNFSGWHKFNNNINYDIILPLKGNLQIKKKDNSKYSNKNFLKAFINIKGNIKNPVLNFSIIDTIKDTFDQQKKDLKNILLGKYRKKRKKNFIKNEYFKFS